MKKLFFKIYSKLKNRSLNLSSWNQLEAKKIIDRKQIEEIKF